MTEKKTHLTFPCQFPIKVMGPAGPEFEARMLMIIRKHAGDFNENAIETRLSKDSNFQAITVTITATSKKQLDDIYLELNADKEVLMTL